ncbi:class I SAM-dependent methyltransferase [Myxococcota bacterium]
MEVTKHNRLAWDRYVESGNPWTMPVSSEAVQAARHDRWEVLLTPTKSVPRTWFPHLRRADILCLAGGGGQQGPILAAAGGNVTVFDNSPRQLEQDQFVAGRDGLSLSTVEGDMADLDCFADQSFDLIFHPVSNCFVPDVRPVWREAFRVLRPGGTLLAGFANPVLYLFDDDQVEKTGELKVVHRIPYSDTESLSEERQRVFLEEGKPLEFGHTLEDQIGGQLECGFSLMALYEDSSPEKENILAQHLPLFMATCAEKPEVNKPPKT